MTQEEERILAEALRLPPDARADLAERLLISVEPGAAQDVERAWRQEVVERARQLDAGEVQPVPEETARARLRGLLDDLASKT